MFQWLLNTVPRPWLIRGSYLIRPLISWYYKGNRYQDPIDGSNFRKMLPYGYAVKRENVLSPSTLSLERHRLLWLYLQRETDFFEKRYDVLHVAPEQCFLSRFRESDNLKLTTTDLESPIVDIKADITNLPFPDSSYDVVLCNHVLEHIPDDRAAMSEIFRVLRPGGWAILQVPMENERAVTYEDDTITDREERTRIFGQYDHVRVYGQDYFDRLRSVGFDAQGVDYTSTLTTDEVGRYRLAAGELIPLAQKPV